jgi:hypothetical protein
VEIKCCDFATTKNTLSAVRHLTCSPRCHLHTLSFFGSGACTLSYVSHVCRKKRNKYVLVEAIVFYLNCVFNLRLDPRDLTWSLMRRFGAMGTRRAERVMGFLRCYASTWKLWYRSDFQPPQNTCMRVIQFIIFSAPLINACKFWVTSACAVGANG